MEPISSFELPPGFRFHPSDEELITHYLLNKANSRQVPASIIADVELYNHNPWDLPKKALFGDEEWYFFSPRDRKYPKGARPNRTTASGYWKATGTDRPILSSSGSIRIGLKKALVFYKGRPPKGGKTDWIMDEYRLPDNFMRPSRSGGSMRLDDWVLCRVRQKGNMSKNTTEALDRHDQPVMYLPRIEELPPAQKSPSSDIIPDFNLPKDCPIITSLLTGQNLLSIQSISSCSSVYEDSSSKSQTHQVNFFLDSLLSPSMAEAKEGNKYESLFQFSNTGTWGNQTEALLKGNVQTDNDTKFFNQNMTQKTFASNPSYGIVNFQEHNDSAFSGRFL